MVLTVEVMWAEPAHMSQATYFQQWKLTVLNLETRLNRHLFNSGSYVCWTWKHLNRHPFNSGSYVG